VTLGAITAIAVGPVGSGPVRLELGAFTGELVQGDWSRHPRQDVDPPAARDGVTSFYHRATSRHSRLDLPLLAGGGPLRVTFRATTLVRSAVDVYVSGTPVGFVLVTPGPWDNYHLEVSAGRLPPGTRLDLGLALRPLPRVPGAHIDTPELRVDAVEIEAPAGMTSSSHARLVSAAVPVAFFLFALAVGAGPRCALVAAVAASVAVVVLFRAGPFSVVLALPRLVPVSFLAGLLVRWLLARAKNVTPGVRAALAGLVTAGTLSHGSLVFLPDHWPPDIDIHVRRTLDLADLPLDYDAILRYGSQLPTASQIRGQATAALGEKTLIPYSPLPYLFYYALHALGLDLYWAMTAVNGALAMAVAALVFVVADRLWGRGSAWTAAILYSLDLAVWHHLGRSHAPAVFGGALGTAALLYLLLRAERLEGRRAVLAAGAVLGTAVLGYSSLVVQFGLLGAVLLVLLALDARGLSAGSRKGHALALVVGGLLAGAVFYFHYVPGLLSGAGSVEAEPDLFPGRTFFIFHNESKESYRIWVRGYWIPLVAGLAAAPWALRRVAASARPLLIAWLAAWWLVMLLKEPFLFPKLLRWAKEDQFLSPLLCLLMAGALGALSRPWMRWGAGLAAVGGALLLQLLDFWHHAVSLRLDNMSGFWP
jgi:hypothetical protein